MNNLDVTNAKKLINALRNVLYFADDNTSGEDIIAALGYVAGDVMAGQDSEEVEYEVLGKLLSSAFISYLRNKGYKVKYNG